MTQEEKLLLLNDICGRLPYGVIVDNPNPSGGVWDEVINIDISTKTVTLLYNGRVFNVDYVRPYLHPMSSMTEEEKELMKGSVICFNELEGNSTLFDEIGLDWLNAHHFDFRGLIEKGLALEAPEGMYKTE